jgi:hypothetical protein
MFFLFSSLKQSSENDNMVLFYKWKENFNKFSRFEKRVNDWDLNPGLNRIGENDFHGPG